LLPALVAVPGIERWRISSIEPNLLTDDLLNFISTEPKMCPHVHIPLQSGDDHVLRLMRRRYSTVDCVRLLEKVRTVMPHAGIGVDIIVGFPGETEACFAATHEFIAALPVSYLHVFTYSERPNTPAANYQDPVEPRVRFARSNALRILSHMKRQAFMRAMVGTRQEVLVEQELHGPHRLGFTGNYIRTTIAADAAAGNTLLPVEISDVRGDVCFARPITGDV
jgi:threonylcarbamoyladenosine tRNA methylthiotransferase MtaB